MTVVWRRYSLTIGMILLFHHTAVHAERTHEGPPPSYTEAITGIQEQGIGTLMELTPTPTLRAVVPLHMRLSPIPRAVHFATGLD